MLKENVSRADFATRLQGIIDRYNAGSSSADNYFNELVKFARDLHVESERHIRERLTEEELELFDPIKKDKMTADGTTAVPYDEPVGGPVDAVLLGRDRKAVVMRWKKYRSESLTWSAIQFFGASVTKYQNRRWFPDADNTVI